MKKVLVTGANGFLAQHLCLYLASKNFDVIAASRGECHIPRKENFQFYCVDLTEEVAVQQMLQAINHDIIIHAAAMSKPDECEKNKEECLKQNVEATKYLLKNASSANAHFIYISTDFVFGENGPHSEEDKTSPLNFYGESKLIAEKSVTESALNNSIVRPVFIYGEIWEGMRPTFLHWVKNNLEQHKKIKVVSDQYRTPTFVLDICKGIETIVQQGLQGIYHLAGKDILSPYQMAVMTAKILQLDEDLIEEVTSETFREPVKRAKKSGLKIDKAIRELNYRPVSFEDGIKHTFNL
jgi:dTDP-4-dehydrorhamnose reductase